MNPLTTPVHVGVDVAKPRLDLDLPAPHHTLPNTPEGHAVAVEALKSIPGAHVVLEASGGYERPFVAALHRAGLPVSVVEPRRVRQFAHASGRRAKTDPLDARALTAFGQALRPAPTPPGTEAERRLAALVQRRRQLQEALCREQNQTEGMVRQGSAPAKAAPCRTSAPSRSPLRRRPPPGRPPCQRRRTPARPPVRPRLRPPRQNRPARRPRPHRLRPGPPARAHAPRHRGRAPSGRPRATPSPAPGSPLPRAEPDRRHGPTRICSGKAAPCRTSAPSRSPGSTPPSPPTSPKRRACAPAPPRSTP